MLTNPYRETVSLEWQSAHIPVPHSRASMNKKAQQPLNPSPSPCQSSPLTDAITGQERLLLENNFTAADGERRNSQFSGLLLHLSVPEVHGLF